MSALTFACKHRLNPHFVLDAQFECGGDVTALFGPSGSGKTSILGVIAGILRPAAGQVHLDGRTVLDTANKVFVPPDKRNIAVVFQEHLLFPHLTVEKNLTYGAPRAKSARQDLDKVAEILGLTALLERYPNSLSGGQQQRVALGRAILRRPRLLLMDEPLAALDEPLKERILSYLERLLHEYRIPTLFVSHDQTDVRRFAKSIVILEEGRVVDAGPVRETLDRAMTSHLRSYSAPVNLVRVSNIRHADGHWDGDLGIQRLAFTAADSLPGPTALVQFRPRDVSLTHGTVQGVSIRNQLTGTVREVVLATDRAFVAVDIGELIWAEVTHHVLPELGIEPGATVTCLLKASAAQAVM